MNTQLTVRDSGSILVCLVALVPYLILADIMSYQSLLASGLYMAVLTTYLGWSYYVVEYRAAYRHVFSPTVLAIALSLCTVSVVLLGWVPLSLIAFVHLAAINIMFVFWFVMLAAIYQTVTTRDEFASISEYPAITVLVPAYNEEGYVGRTITGLLEASYPDDKKRIIVVDDGSTDGTYAEAQQYESETVTVVTKENGGKYSALNYGLLFADTEIIVTVDADSIIGGNALRDIVAPLEADPEIGAVASNVRIFNRESLVEKCQTLEYIFGINTYRRVFDHFGAVSVVPGCLGAYRRSVLDEIHGYDPETLTEDFDTTLKVLKQGYKIRFSDAVVYTEAPDTWRDLYKQRLRWYRGNIMTVRKHLAGAVNPDNQYLQRIHLPRTLVTMVFIPFASWVILGVIAYIALTGSLMTVLILFVLFTSIIVCSNILAIRIEGDSLWYALYSPLFVIGYKHFHDVIMLKSIIDVLRDRETTWTSPTRVDQRDTTATERSADSHSD